MSTDQPPSRQPVPVLPVGPFRAKSDPYRLTAKLSWIIPIMSVGFWILMPRARSSRADLVIGADGRSSVVRERANLVVEDVGAPIDVLWMRLSRKPRDTGQSFGHIEAGAIFVMLDRGDYWQCGYVIPKGAFDGIRARGIEAFRARIASIVPFLSDRVGELRPSGTFLA